MEIQTKSASLDTLSVTIQALHVNGKQMTLAVFRQLPIASAYITEDESSIGAIAPMEFWGIVRYNIKDEGDLWVVAASRGRLYRCCVIPILSNGHSYPTLEEANKDLNNAMLDIMWWRSVNNDTTKEGHKKNYETHYSQAQRERLSWHEKLITDLNDQLDWYRNRVTIIERVEKTKESLMQLPQLFIAV